MARNRSGGGNTVVIEADFARGIVRDAPRASILAGGLYDAADMLLDQPGVARERGGTSYSGAALGANTYAVAPFYADFSTGGKLMAVADNGHLFEVAGTSTDRSTLGSTFVSVSNLAMVNDVVVIPSNDGTTAPKKAYISGGTLTGANLGGSPPAGKYTCAYYSRVVLAGVLAHPRRVYFSPIPDPEGTWDTATSYIDAEHNVTGVFPLPGALLVFSEGFYERISGTTPPPGTDMQITEIEPVGCIDARSLVGYQDACIFANLNGVYLTNGVRSDNLCERPDGSGIGTYWRSLMSSWSSSTWTIAAGVFFDYYVVSVMNGSTLIVTLLLHIPTRRWQRLTNVKATGFALQAGSTPKLHYSDRASARVIDLSGIFTKASGNKNDADGTAVAGVLEYRMLGSGIGLKAYGFGRLTYDLRDAASDNPTVAVAVATGINADSYSAVGESPLAETSTATRKRFTIAKDSQAVNLKLTRSGASSVFTVSGLEAEVRSYPDSHDGV